MSGSGSGSGSGAGAGATPAPSRHTELRAGGAGAGALLPLVHILERHGLWQRVMAAVPAHPAQLRLPRYPAKYNARDVDIIIEHAERHGQLKTVVFFDDWGTSGRKEERPTLDTLQRVLARTQLYEAMDEMARILGDEEPQRPAIGPAARVNTDVSQLVIESQLNNITTINSDQLAPMQTYNINIDTAYNGQNGRSKDFPNFIEPDLNSTGYIQSSHNLIEFSHNKLETHSNNESTEQNNHLSNDVTHLSENNHVPTTVETGVPIGLSSLDDYNTSPLNSSSIMNHKSNLNNDSRNDVTQLPDNSDYPTTTESEVPLGLSSVDNYEPSTQNSSSGTSNNPSGATIGSQSSSIPSERISSIKTVSGSDYVTSQGSIETSNSPVEVSMSMLPVALQDITYQKSLPNIVIQPPSNNEPTDSDNLIKRYGIKYRFEDLIRMTRNFSLDYDLQRNIGGKIGEGGFGEVYVGFDENGCALAIKKLFKGSTKKAHENILRQFYAEVEMSRFNHDNLVKILGYSMDGPDMCVVSEYVSGGNLRMNLDKRFLTKEQRFDILLGTAKGLQYLHFGLPKLIHKDVTSVNILLTEEFVPKLCDFGLTRFQDTSTTELYGTNVYIAPEARRNDISPKMDVFSYGIVLLETLTGLSTTLPYGNGTKNIETYIEDELNARGNRNDITPLLEDTIRDWPIGNVLFYLARNCLDEMITRPDTNTLCKMLEDFRVRTNFNDLILLHGKYIYPDSTGQYKLSF